MSEVLWCRGSKSDLSHPGQPFKKVAGMSMTSLYTVSNRLELIRFIRLEGELGAGGKGMANVQHNC